MWGATLAPSPPTAQAEAAAQAADPGTTGALEARVQLGSGCGKHGGGPVQGRGTGSAVPGRGESGQALTYMLCHPLWINPRGGTYHPAYRWGH